MNFMENESRDKLRGGYYTPDEISLFITRWIMKNKPQKLLEPSCGDGVFIRAISEISPKWKGDFLGIEFDQTEAQKAKQCLSSSKLNGHVLSQDFLGWYLEALSSAISFDSVIGNPPFIRYQYLPEEMQIKAESIFDNLGLKFTRHTNAWIPFVLASINLLRPGGRLGMVIPTEIFNVIYAQSLRTYLGNTCSKLLIIDPEDIWFKDTLQGAVILLAEKKESHIDFSYGLGIKRTKGLSFTKDDADDYFDSATYLNGRTTLGKWSFAFLTSEELSLYDQYAQLDCIKPFSEIAKVDVGIVTGANDFFLVDEDTVHKYDLNKFAHPMFGRSDHCPGIIFNQATHAKNAENGLPSYFIWFDEKNTKKLTKKQKEYISWGESQNLHTRYKCRIRTPWYAVPSVYSTEVGMLKRSHDCPRLILNSAHAYTTDTAYRVKSLTVSPNILVYSFVNSLTALSAELEGRSYGGGVLELVPSEIEKLLVPIPNKVTPNLNELDSMVKGKKASEYLAYQDSIILKAVGASKADREILHSAWLKLRSRRQRISS